MPPTALSTPPTFEEVCAAAKVHEVVIPPYDGIRFRIRRVSTETLAEVGSAQALVIREHRAAATAAVAAGGDVPVVDTAALRKQASLADSILAAGVVAVDWGQGFQPVTIALTDEQRAAGALRPSDDWPPGLPAGVLKEILQLGGDDKGAAVRIATFLGVPAAP